MASDDRAGNEVSDLLESFRQVGQTGQAGLAAARDASKAFRTLVSADVSLARSAFGRTLAFTAVAIVFGASAWLLLMASVVGLLVWRAGWGCCPTPRWSATGPPWPRSACRRATTRTLGPSSARA